ncbi:endonuclease/exonuclease/phosphatase family protein [Pseudaestuariivita atlantica]|uniref:endonuclease/exonuclease/phosphatase family protein n=1 Tax=Pseudaestuariivita atlantica TaxID=1317121 RepID=UPI000AA98E9C|nr:endonuclease/exonuclease/phosphatase family protein [Pseudaestuariivita atlantica]
MVDEISEPLSYIKEMKPQHLRIASYNIRKARGLDQRRDPGRILDVINAVDADIVVLQEADLRFGKRKAAIPRQMIAQNTDHDVVPLAQFEESLGWHGNAVLLRRDLSVSATTCMELPGLEPRGAAKVDVSGAIQLTLVAAHLGLRRRDRRAQQAAICAELPAHGNSIVAGDFNEWSPSNGLENFKKELRVHAPGPSFPTRLPVARLDRFAMSAGLQIVASGTYSSKEARRASDHLPIWCAVAETAQVTAAS